MKQVSIDSIQIEGFGTYLKPFHFDFNRKGVNIIKAPNGKGKTTIFSAMTWSLYGINLKGVVKKDVVTWKHLRPKAFKGTQVAVNLTVDGVNYTIVRHIAYKGDFNGLTGGDTLMIWEGDKLVSQGKDLDTIQESINHIVGLDGKLFLNSVMFAQRSKKFINADNKDKREVLEQVFDLEWVSQASEIAKKEATRLSEELKILEGEYRQVEIPYNSQLAAYNANSTNHKANLERNASEQSKNLLDIQDNERALAEKESLLINANAEYIERQIYELTTQKDAVEPLIATLTNQALVVSTEQANRDSELSFTLQTERDLNAKINIITETNKKLSEELNGLSAGKGDTIAKIDALLAEKDVSIATVSASIKETTEYLSTLQPRDGVEIEAAIIELGIQKANISSDITTAERDLSLTKLRLDHLTDPCPTCGEILNPNRMESESTRIKQLICESEDKIEKLTDELAKASEQLKDWVNEKTIRSRWDEATLQLSNFNRDLSRLEAEKATLTSEKSVLLSGTREVQIQQEISSNDQQLATLNQESIKVLTTISHLTIAKEEDKRLEDINSTLSTHKQSLVLINTKLDEQKNLQLSLASALSDRNHLQEAKSRLITYAERLKLEHTQLLSEANELVKDYDKLMLMYNSLVSVDSRRQSVQAEMDRYKYWQNTGFGTSGMKSLLFSVMLSKLNVAMQTYSQRLGVSARFLVNMDKARRDIEVEVLKDGHVVGYDNLSGGEAARVDVISVFGMHDLISSADVNLNILVLDECTENLDQNGTDEVFNLIKFKQQTTPNIWVITHNPEVNIVNANVVDLEYEQAK